MAEHGDEAERLARLEARLAEHRKAREPAPRAETTAIGQANIAWRMIVELVSGLLIGFGIGYGLDMVFGTGPLFLVLFVLFGFGAGVNVMLHTAREIAEEAEAQADADGERG